MKKLILWSIIFGLSHTLLMAQTGWYIIPSPTEEHLLEITRHSFTASDWVMGENGTLFSTPDHGETWEILNSGVSVDIRGHHGPASFQDWIAGSSGMVLVSFDLGETWLDRSPGSSENFNTIFSRGSGTAYVAGDNGIIYYSDDMGQNWASRNPPTIEHLNAGIGPTSGTSLHALVGGERGVIFKTIDAGENWIETSPGLLLDIFDFVVGPSNIVFAVGAGGLILKSIDSGDTWSVIPTPTNQDLYSINSSGQNANWIVVVGANGTILKSTDGGETWFSQSSPTEEHLYSVYTATNNVHLAVGVNGVIIKTIDGGGEAVGIEDQINPSAGLTLEQNFPNPFNKSTEISYTLFEGEYITLKIYDIHGKEVETLVNEFKSRGSYEIYFDAIDLPAGTYHYRLQSDNYILTKKMLLID